MNTIMIKTNIKEIMEKDTDSAEALDAVIKNLTELSKVIDSDNIKRVLEEVVSTIETFTKTNNKSKEVATEYDEILKMFTKVRKEHIIELINKFKADRNEDLELAAKALRATTPEIDDVTVANLLLDAVVAAEKNLSFDLQRYENKFAKLLDELYEYTISTRDDEQQKTSSNPPGDLSTFPIQPGAVVRATPANCETEWPPYAKPNGLYKVILLGWDREVILQLKDISDGSIICLPASMTTLVCKHTEPEYIMDLKSDPKSIIIRRNDNKKAIIVINKTPHEGLDTSVEERAELILKALNSKNM